MFARVLVLAFLGGCSSLLGVHEPSQVSDRLTIDSPAGQTGTVDTELPPIVITIADGNGNGVGGVTVNFAITGGNGHVSDEIAITDAQGHALSTLTLGTIAGTNTVEVRTSALDPVELTALGLPGTPSATTSTVSANPTSTVIADGVASSQITVTIRDEFGNPIEGQAVVLAATGVANSITQTGETDASGVTTGAIATTRAESKTITASTESTTLAQQPTVAFVAGTQHEILLASGNDQQGTPSGVALPVPFVVTVRDTNQNPVTGVLVSFVVVAGGGSLSSPTGITDTQGHAQTTLTLGSSSATNTVEARVMGLIGSPVTFTAIPYGFAAKVNFATGTSPFSIVIGDFNADGKPDLAITNCTSPGSVSILLNTTTLVTNVTFAAKVDFPTGIAPCAIAIGDFNGDGKPDLAVVNEGPSTVSVLLNTTTAGAGTPSFAGKVDFATGNQPTGIAVGDLNGDGKPDLAVTNISGPDTVSIFLNTTTTGAATPSFALKVDFATGVQPNSIAIADLDKDGKLDLAVTNSNSSTVSILRGTTTTGSMTPTFATKVDFPVGANPDAIAIGDFDGDTKLDLAIANRTANTVSILLNTTAGTLGFAPKDDFPTGNGPTAVAIGDLSGDGKLDVALTNFSSNTVSTLLAGTTGFGTKIDFAVGQNPTCVAIDDFNGDGKPDLAVGNQTDNTVSVLLRL